MSRKPFVFKRTMPVPAGHCPEPIMEIGGMWHGWDRALYWYPQYDGITFKCEHSYGGAEYGRTARLVSEFGGKIMDDHADLRLPWSVAPLEGKYYGTHVLDARGEEVAEFWDHSHDSGPSEREKAHFGRDWTEEKWNEYVCDSHWECERDYARALAIVNAMNSTTPPAASGAEERK